ncbi:MAG: ATP-binding protein [Solirubrobacterales bacterium]
MTAALEDTRVVMILGARQVGKSTLAEEVAMQERGRQILSFDTAATREAAERDPKGFVAGLSGPALIDEVQRVPDILLEIKHAVDQDQRPGRFLLTGSANVFTAPKVRDALTGRAEFIRLWPLAQTEIERTATNLVDALFAGDPPQIRGAPVGREAFVARVAAGGYPQARRRADPKRRRAWFSSYVESLIERDLRDLASAQKLVEVPRLLRLIASRAGGLYVPGSISQRIGLDAKTVKSYVQLLETVFLVRVLPAWRPGLGAREVAHGKACVVDSGLLAHLLNASERRISEDDQISGPILESFAAMELLRQLEWSEVGAGLYHYRRGRQEIDLLLESPEQEVVALEVKAAATIRAGDWVALERLRDDRGSSFKAGVVLHTGDQTLPLGDRLWALPISALWA